MNQWSMRRQVAALVFAVSAMIVVAFCVPLALVVRVVAHDRVLHAAELQARAVAAALAGTVEPAVLAPIVIQTGAEGNRPMSVFLPNGAVVGDPTPERDPAMLQRARRGEAFSVDTAGAMTLYEPVFISGGKVAVVRVGIPGSQLDRGVVAAWSALGALGVLLIGLAVALADRLSARVVRSVRALQEVTTRLRTGDRDVRVTPQGPPEVVDVGIAVNQLADRIDDLLTAEREAAADLSHQLRTPLTALRLDVETLRPGAPRTRLEESVQTLSATVDEIINATRSPQRRTPTAAAAQTTLVSTVADRVEFWQVLAHAQNRSLVLALPEEDVQVPLPAEELVAVVDAAIGNVFAHTPPGTAFRVAVEHTDGDASLTIDDDGPGFADPSPQTRGASGAGSTGLGLDIVRRSAESAGGGCTIRNKATGGAQVHITFATGAAAKVNADVRASGPRA